VGGAGAGPDVTVHRVGDQQARGEHAADEQLLAAGLPASDEGPGDEQLGRASAERHPDRSYEPVASDDASDSRSAARSPRSTSRRTAKACLGE
jgi:hypothetical protein